MTLELTQYSANELAQMPFTEFIHPQDRDMVLERHRKRLKGEEALSTYDFRIISKNGNLLWVHINPVLITWEGRPGTLNFLRDITSQKKLEAQLRQAQKMEAIGTLAGGVAHDLNNILSGLVSYPELVLLDIPEESPLRKPMLTIQKAGQKAAAIVQDMLTLARRGVSVAEVVNLNQIIRQYLASLECEKLLSFHPGAKVETELEANLLNILGSPVHLSKTIMNLVSNAAEAMPEGGTISISTQSRYLDKLLNGYETIDAGEYVILTVADIGTGISPAEIDKIFEPFYTKKAMGRSGTGLGMAVVWGTIKDHKGYIHVDSDEGKKPIRSNDIPTTSEKYKGEGQTILVVDDVKEQREIAAKILTQLGYSVETVSSGEKAFEYLESKPADLIVLDMIMLPGIDGLETYKKIISKYPQQRAIIASGFSETDRVREAQRLGAGRYVKKPYTIEKIGMAVKSELSKPQKAA
jgi:PAS domain S-box-containing protein